MYMQPYVCKGSTQKYLFMTTGKQWAPFLQHGGQTQASVTVSAGFLHSSQCVM